MGVLIMPVCGDCRYRKFDAGQRDWFCSRSEEEQQECLRMAILGDWETEVTGGGELTPEEEAQARKEYEELKVLVRRK